MTPSAVTIDDSRHQRPAPFTPRAIPADFEECYVTMGHQALPDHYRASERTVRAWVVSFGRDALKAKRAAHLRHIADASNRHCTARPTLARNITTAERRRRAIAAKQPEPDREALRDAAHYLRFPRNGGFRVSMATNGEWFVGAVRVTSHDLVKWAMNRGFSPLAVKLETE